MSILTCGLVIKSFVFVLTVIFGCVYMRGPLSMGYVYIHIILYIYMNEIFCVFKELKSFKFSAFSAVNIFGSR